MDRDVRTMLGDCLDRMAEIADGSVDLVLADLPYGTTACKWDVVIPFEPLWSHYKRVLKARGAVVLTASQPFTSALVMSNLEWFKYTRVWKHNSPKGQNAKHQPVRYHEDIAVFSWAKCGNGCSSRMTYNPLGITRVDRVRNEPDGGPTRNHRPGRAFTVRRYVQTHTGYPGSIIEIDCDGAQHQRLHPTQKPVALMEYLIRTYSDPDDLVLDNTMGSGTTVVAAINTDRRVIGIEKDPAIFATAQARIAEHRSSMPLLEGVS